MGYIRGFIHGTAAGAVIGLCLAPQTGDKTRAQLRTGWNAAREGAVATGHALRRVAPMAGGAMHAVDRVRHRGDAIPSGDGRVGASTA